MAQHWNHRIVGGDSTTKGTAYEHDISAFCLIRGYMHEPIPNWTAVSPSPPVALAMETGEAGDDLRIDFDDGVVAECQLKSGSITGPEGLDIITNGFQNLRDSGSLRLVLVIDTKASGNLRRLGLDLDAYRNGSSGDMGDQFQKLREALRGEEEFLHRIHVIKMDEGDSTRAALLKSMLSRSGLTAGEAVAAIDLARAACEEWRKMSKDGISPDDLAQRWKDGRIKVVPPTSNPVISVHQLQCSQLRILHPVGLPGIQVARSGIPIPTRLDKPEEERELNDWQVLEKRHRCIVTGEPGSGKSDWVARAILGAEMSRRVAAKAVSIAQTIASGSPRPIEQALARDSGYESDAISASIKSQTGMLLVDGLDEVGDHANDVVRAVEAWANKHPNWVVALVGRPGIDQLELPDWHRLKLKTPSDHETDAIGKALVEALVQVDGGDADALWAELKKALRDTRSGIRNYPLTACALVAHIRHSGAGPASFRDVLGTVMEAYIGAITKEFNVATSESVDQLLPLIALHSQYERLNLDAGKLGDFAWDVLPSGEFGSKAELRAAISEALDACEQVDLIEQSTMAFAHQSVEDYLAAKASKLLPEPIRQTWIRAQVSIYGQGDAIEFLPAEALTEGTANTMVESFLEKDNLYSVECLGKVCSGDLPMQGAEESWRLVLGSLQSNNISRSSRLLRAIVRARNTVAAIDGDALPELPADAEPHEVLANATVRLILGEEDRAINDVSRHALAINDACLANGGLFISTETGMVKEFLELALVHELSPDQKARIQTTIDAVVPSLGQMVVASYMRLQLLAVKQGLNFPDLASEALEKMPKLDPIKWAFSIVHHFRLLEGYDAAPVGDNEDGDYARRAGLRLFGDRTARELFKRELTAEEIDNMQFILTRNLQRIEADTDRVLRGTKRIESAVNGGDSFEHEFDVEDDEFSDVQQAKTAEVEAAMIGAIAIGPPAARYLVVKELAANESGLDDTPENRQLLTQLYEDCGSREGLRVLTILAGHLDKHLMRELIENTFSRTLADAHAGIIEAIGPVKKWNFAYFEKGLESGISDLQAAVFAKLPSTDSDGREKLRPQVLALIEPAMDTVVECTSGEDGCTNSAWYRACPKHGGVLVHRPARQAVYVAMSEGWISSEEWIDLNERIVASGGPPGIGLAPLLAREPHFARVILEGITEGRFDCILLPDCLPFVDLEDSHVFGWVEGLMTQSQPSKAMLAFLIRKGSDASIAERTLLDELLESEDANVRERSYETQQYILGYGPKPSTFGLDLRRHGYSDEDEWVPTELGQG